ncbi:hypothetical protein ACFQDN_08965 [Pseudomonas asuensis]
MNTRTLPRGSLIPADIEATLSELTVLRDEMVAAACDAPILAEHVHQSYAESARNLLNYLALRRHDIRPLQARLAQLGLSSLGRSEAYILASVTTLIEVLQKLSDSKDTAIL